MTSDHIDPVPLRWSRDGTVASGPDGIEALIRRDAARACWRIEVRTESGRIARSTHTGSHDGARATAETLAASLFDGGEKISGEENG